ncbi:MAG TPA: Stp1/IreP family PP2C-type Ser/Thr phosphatase [Candidatus Hydrogenedentes bacterium]|nr:Stp1/IreP family PP2C-type Ser/Thr phosphatase [Candidatus Hydrogenedentota bacterium]
MYEKETPLKRDNPEARLGPLDGHNFETAWSGPFLDIQVITDVGKKRQNNEDSCLLFVPESESMRDSRGVLVAVADGMGGASAGEYASRTALQCLVKKFYDKNLHTLVPNALKLSVECANEYVFDEAEANPDYAGMGTTISALTILGNWAYMAQVGDSRIYLKRASQPLKQLTNDHSLVAEQIRSGLINEEDARNHTLKNLITRAVGIKEDINVDLFALQLQVGDVLLLCSDGLSNMVSPEDINLYLETNDVQQAARDLVQHALAAGGVDNITVIVVRLTAPPPITNYQQGAKTISFEQPGLLTRLRSIFTGR